MTDDTMNLQALVGKSADADFLREIIGFAAQQLGRLGGRWSGRRRYVRSPKGTGRLAKQLSQKGMITRQSCPGNHGERSRPKLVWERMSCVVTERDLEASNVSERGREP